MISKRIIPALEGASGIRRAFNEAQRQYQIYGKENVFDLSLGNPSAPAPDKVKESIYAILEDEEFDHRYMNNAGFADTRKRLVESINAREQTTYDSDEIVMTTGVAGGLNILMCSIIDPEDEVIVFAPFYSDYRNFVTNWGGIIKVVPPKGADFWPDFDAFEDTLTAKTKAVIINSPHNPTGTIYPEEVAVKLSEIMQKKQKEFGTDIILVSDEPYRDLVYEDRKLPWWPDYYSNTVVCYSFSKSLSLAGERIGYLLIPKNVTEGERLVKAVRSAMGRCGFVNAPALFQKVVGYCADEKVDLDYYKENREILYSALKNAGFQMVEPRGAFYIFVKCPISEKEFVDLGIKHHLMMVGGSTFGYEGYVRLSFCCERKVLEGATTVIETLAKECGLKK